VSLSLVLTYVSVVSCAKYTVTEEAWFELEAKDIDGEGNDFNGRITIALFGDTVPITVLNFASLARGYKKDKV